jgi:small subunit ribosomal protein S1
MTMADLLAKQDQKNLKLERNQEVEGTVVHIGSDVVLDLGSKAEGVIPRKDFSDEQLDSLKAGDKLTAFVVRSENESGQVLLGLSRAVSGPSRGGHRKNWDKFISAKNKSQVFKGKALELNKGGLIVEVEGVRGFLPSSQVTLSQASKMDELVGNDLQVSVIEVDPGQNRLIFTQKTAVTEETRKKLAEVKQGDKIKGRVEAILPFGVFAALENGLEGLVHISELSWDKVDEPGAFFKVGDDIEGVVTNVDLNTGRVNFSVRQLKGDPFAEAAKNFQPEDVVSGVVTKVSSLGVSLELEGGVEGLIHSSKMEADLEYPVGKKITCLVDGIDNQKRRVNLVPFRTSTKDLIYK